MRPTNGTVNIQLALGDTLRYSIEHSLEEGFSLQISVVTPRGEDVTLEYEPEELLALVRDAEENG